MVNQNFSSSCKIYNFIRFMRQRTQDYTSNTHQTHSNFRNSNTKKWLDDFAPSYAQDYSAIAPQTMSYLDYLRSLVNELFHTLDRHHGTDYHTAWELHLRWTVSRDSWRRICLIGLRLVVDSLSVLLSDCCSATNQPTNMYKMRFKKYQIWICLL